MRLYSREMVLSLVEATLKELDAFCNIINYQSSILSGAGTILPWQGYDMHFEIWRARYPQSIVRLTANVIVSIVSLTMLTLSTFNVTETLLCPQW